MLEQKFSTKIKKDARKIIRAIDEWPLVYLFGNGGSCAIANHAEVDWMKRSNGRWTVCSLGANPALLTMIANDHGFSETVSYQIMNNSITALRRCLLLISSSGNSPNIVEGAKAARDLGMPVIGLTGFDGGVLKELSDVSIHIDSTDYEMAEDYHQMVIHEVSRLLRKRNG